ncbi:MerR family transcriptional regulator [Blautia glucerasea]|uniref:MerR family transcriptional regulator n=1 Tax=Blautia glucerasea TaxID=536633 RepID=UPI001D002ED4|nr:MerR family transcriptional regulator [Blautia glucerasea]MCB5386196.1 MerR family transcriptional regulator [Blautia glucerasea]MCB5420550.1 MerR family transcriptional regulator [Blautia luti]
MESKDLFQIGEVARMFHLSVSSLRHYEAMGLLVPEVTDPETGYRYYSTRQFEPLNTIRYLRALDMPLNEIADFLQNRDLDKMEEKLQQQKEIVIKREQELKRIERKIGNRLNQLKDARNSVLDVIALTTARACRLVWMEDNLTIKEFVDMETPIRKLEQKQKEALIFLGKVGVGIAAEQLLKGQFQQYNGIFLLLDEEDQYDGTVIHLQETPCVSVRFRGSHKEAPAQYEKLMNYIQEHNLKVAGFSREITMIDYGLTNDTEKFVTEISIPVKVS